MADRNKSNKVSILIPCFNEERSIAKVVSDFRRELPDAEIYVYDNDSTDDTAREAQAVGAIVRHEKRRGKGFVLRSMFAQADADICVLVDGDDTYPAESVHELIRLVAEEGHDMVVGNRLELPENKHCFRRFHLAGNKMVAATISLLFGTPVGDVMSGYRAFSRRFVKSVPLISRGFELETQLTSQAIFYGFGVKEIAIPFRDRSDGSESKLRTFHDGMKVLREIINACKAYRPMLFFSLIAILAWLTAGTCLLFSPPDFENLNTLGELGALIAPAVIFICGVIVFMAGIILDSTSHRMQEIVQLILNRQ